MWRRNVDSAVFLWKVLTERMPLAAGSRPTRPPSGLQAAARSARAAS